MVVLSDYCYLFILALLPIKTNCQSSSDYNFDCKPKAGCHISQCDPVPRGLSNLGVQDYLKRNEYPIQCQEKSGVSTKDLMKIVARLDQDVKSTKQDMTLQYARISATRDAKIRSSEMKMKENRILDIKAEIRKNNLYMDGKNAALERKIQRELTKEIENQIAIVNKTQEKQLEELEKSYESATAMAINSLRSELTDAMNRMEARLLKVIDTTIKESLKSPSKPSLKLPVPRKPTKKPVKPRPKKPATKKPLPKKPTRPPRITRKPIAEKPPKRTAKPSKPPKTTVPIRTTESERASTQFSFSRLANLFGLSDFTFLQTTEATRAVTEAPKATISSWTSAGPREVPSLPGTDDKYCKVKYAGRFCYWVETYSWKNIDFEQASKTCEGNGGGAANIYSKSHFDNIVNLVRSEMNSIDEHIVVWLGMTVDPETGTLFYRSGSSTRLSTWFPGYPDTGTRFSDSKNVYLYVQRDPDSSFQGMVNVQPSGQYPGVVCERTQ